jgi:uncharacterized phage protein (TIGR02220 family)
MCGFITMHRQLLEWEWYKDTNTKSLFIHCLLKANWEDKSWKGITIKRGDFITSNDTLANELKLSVKEIRTAISKLEKTNEIIKKGASKYTLLTVVKYDIYQNINALGANKGQTKGKQRATTNNINNINNNNISQIKICDIVSEDTKVIESNINWAELLNFINKITGKKFRVVPDKTKAQIKLRLKEGYTKQDFANAIQNCFLDKYHQENRRFLTLEFISRSDKMEKFATDCLKPKLKQDRL